VLLARRSHGLQLSEDFNDGVDGGRVGGGGVAAKTEELHELGLKDGEAETCVVKGIKRRQGLNKLENVVPLAVQDELKWTKCVFF